jgi:hypothetical protein
VNPSLATRISRSLTLCRSCSLTLDELCSLTLCGSRSLTLDARTTVNRPFDPDPAAAAARPFAAPAAGVVAAVGDAGRGGRAD